MCALRALPGMMQWIRSQRPGESGVNIITADFVELGEFISAVITLNYYMDDEEENATWISKLPNSLVVSITLAPFLFALLCFVFIKFLEHRSSVRLWHFRANKNREDKGRAQTRSGGLISGVEKKIRKVVLFILGKKMTGLFPLFLCFPFVAQLVTRSKHTFPNSASNQSNNN